MSDEMLLWDKTHRDFGYNKRVFSLLDSEIVREKFKYELSKLKNGDRLIRILIPGCGSNINLQLCCIDVFGSAAVVDALDWSIEAINSSKRQTDALGLAVTYYHQSYYDLSLEENSYDIIVSSNAFVSESEENNRIAICKLARLLKAGGSFIGLFPSPFNMLDYALCNPEARCWITDGRVDIVGRRINEDNFTSQRFFSPLEFYMLLRDVGFNQKSIELFFYDDEQFARQISTLYHIKFDNDYCFWGYFINAVK